MRDFKKVTAFYASQIAIILVIGCGVFLFCVQAQDRVDKMKRQTPGDRSPVVRSFERAIPRLMSKGQVPGLYVVLIRNGKVYWHHAYGFKNIDTKAPIDDKTIFETASLTKPVLAYAVLKLVDSGKLDIDTPLIKYLPARSVPSDARSDRITARMVLDHTTGFQNELHPGEELKIHFAPGERFSYSGEGFIYLQKVVEQITGERLDDFMKHAVFDPLGMTSASYLWRDEYEHLMANGHNPAGRVAERIKPKELRISWLHMTPLDYARFVIAIMNGVGLQPRTAKLMLTPQVKIDASCVFCLAPGTGSFSESLAWGLGWGLERTQAGVAFWHWGENRAEFQNFIMANPKQKNGLVVFTNSGNGFSILPDIVSKALPGSESAFAWMGYDRYDSPTKIRFRAETAREDELFQSILARGIPALQQYNDTRKTRPANEVLTETRMNSVGYRLLGKKRFPEAIEVFKQNTIDFPNSWNAYDSLAEAFMVNGNKERAIEYYQKSLDLNPQNRNAVEMIKKLKN